MKMLDEIEKESQLIARYKKLITLEQLRKRKADTRQKIELGGLVIKSGINIYNKSIIFGGLVHMVELIDADDDFKVFLESRGCFF